MTEKWLRGANGYDIPCLLHITGREHTVVVVSHGFGSHKNSSMAQILFQTLPAQGMGVLAFDFPAHGDSPVDGERLRVAGCISDLGDVVRYARMCAPGARIAYFSSSFGAYINLLFLTEQQQAFGKSFLRSAAVNMPQIVLERSTPEQLAAMERDGFVIVDEALSRPLKLTRGFMQDMRDYDLFARYRPGAAQIAMVHGACDRTVDVGQAERFARQFGAALTVIPGGGHRLMDGGQPDEVLHLASAFFMGDECR